MLSDGPLAVGTCWEFSMTGPGTTVFVGLLVELSLGHIVRTYRFAA